MKAPSMQTQTRADPYLQSDGAVALPHMCIVVDDITKEMPPQAIIKVSSQKGKSTLINSRNIFIVEFNLSITNPSFQ